MKIRTFNFVLILLATGFVSSMAALYLAYVIANKKIQQTAQTNPYLNLLSKL